MGWRQNPRSQWALTCQREPDVDSWIAETVLDAVTQLGSLLEPEELALMTESLFDLLTSDPYIIMLRARLKLGRKPLN